MREFNPGAFQSDNEGEMQTLNSCDNAKNSMKPTQRLDETAFEDFTYQLVGGKGFMESVHDDSPAFFSDNGLSPSYEKVTLFVLFQANNRE